jgi:hypothetical protein
MVSSSCAVQKMKEHSYLLPGKSSSIFNVALLEMSAKAFTPAALAPV